VQGDPMLLPLRGAFDESPIQNMNALIAMPVSDR
jgi:hypothetical protein